MQCLNSAGEAVDSALCPGTKPVAAERCNLQACDFCSGSACLGRGDCADSKCSCSEEFTGVHCEVRAS